MNQADVIDIEGFAAFQARQRVRGRVPERVMEAFEAIPRQDFLPPPFQHAAWSERMLPIECGEAIEGADLQLQVIAAMALEPGHRVLEVGTGSGFTAAVMARLAARVLTIDRWKTLADAAHARFEAMSITNASVRQADGSQGAPPNEGPFDRIVVWCAFDSLPRAFVDQVATGGSMIAPIGPSNGTQELIKLSKLGSRFERQEIGTVRLQPLLRGLSAFI